MTLPIALLLLACSSDDASDNDGPPSFVIQPEPAAAPLPAPVPAPSSPPPAEHWSTSSMAGGIGAWS